VKLLAFDQAVNITLGLPIIRTSPDRGTTFDIAGTKPADPGSMKQAIRLACQLAKTAKHPSDHATVAAGRNNDVQRNSRGKS